MVVVQIGKSDETPALVLIEDSEHKVIENAVLDIWEFTVDEGLLQEEVDQRGLVVRVPQGSQALQDAGDAQVVMSVSVKVFESIFPVQCSLHFSRFLVAQLDAIEVQHELVGLQQIFLCFAVFIKIRDLFFRQWTGLVVHAWFLQREQPLNIGVYMLQCIIVSGPILVEVFDIDTVRY